MLTGPEALRSLNEALDDVRREERAIAERLSRASEKLVRLHEGETAHFRALAEERLGNDVREAVTKRLSGAEKRARQMIEKHVAETEAAERRLAKLDDRLAELAKKRDEQNGKLAAAQAALEKLSETVASSLAKDKKFAARKAEAERQREIADRAMEKTRQAEADRDEKGRPYRSDPLFMYLWERGYETRNYKASNLIRALDGWVARLTGYHEARPNFAMLNEIPLRLREHADRLQAAAAKAVDAVEDAELEAVDKAGGRASRLAIETAQAEIAKLDAEVVEIEDQRDEETRTQRQLAEGNDPAFRDAVQLLAENLVREDIGALYAEARATESGRDDSLVAQIEEVRRQIAEHEMEQREDKDRLRTLAARRRELEDIEWQFKKERFDDPRSTFRQDELVGDTLGEFLRGAITAAAYWGMWRNAQTWRDSTRSAGGRIGLPRDAFRGSVWTQGGSPAQPGSADWGRIGGALGGALGGAIGGALGGSLGRPRSGSTGGRRHGGFKTGGKF
jgi:hypothetical protein